jgi:hypothetical protein
MYIKLMTLDDDKAEAAHDQLMTAFRYARENSKGQETQNYRDSD